MLYSHQYYIYVHILLTRINSVIASIYVHILQLFEGLKAYRGVDGKVRLFRPDMNCQRLNKSAEYSCLPVSNYYCCFKIEVLIMYERCVYLIPKLAVGNNIAIFVIAI